MIISPGEPLPPTSEPYDVCIVGAGAAGIILANQLARRGRRVAVIECGNESRWNRTSQALNYSELSGVYHWGIHTGRYRALGGSTTRWSGQVIELDEEDFAERPWLDFAGWPFEKDEIQRFYDEARALLKLPAPLNEAERKEIFDCEAAFAGETAVEYRFSQIAPELKLFRLFHDEVTSKDGATFFTDRCATELLFEPASDRVRGVKCVSQDGQAVEILAKSTVLAMGGIESTRFLLNQRPQLTDRFAYLGKHFTDHLQVEVADVEILQPEAAQSLGPKRVVADGVHMVPKLKLTADAQEKYGLLNAAAMIDYPAEQRKLTRIAAQLILGPTPSLTAANVAYFSLNAHKLAREILAARYKKFERLSTRKRVLTINVEQDPVGPSHIALSDKTDRFGMRLAHLDWRVTEREVKTVATLFDILKKGFEGSGIAKLTAKGPIDAPYVTARTEDSYHHMGGTRMSRSAADGVVDTNLQAHGVEGLFVCSSSVFPCSGFANPTHTIIALSLRLGEHLDAQLKGA